MHSLSKLVAPSAALMLMLAATAAHAAVAYNCQGNATHFGIYAGNDYISAAQIRAGFTRNVDEFATVRAITNFGVNHPVVDAFRITETAGQQILIESPREDRLPTAITAGSGHYRFDVAGEFVECDITVAP